MIKLLKKAIREYGKVNRIKAIEFDERLKKVVEEYNDRDKLVFANEVVKEFVDGLLSMKMNFIHTIRISRALLMTELRLLKIGPRKLKSQLP